MPTFVIQTPDGKFKVTAPDEQTALQAVQGEVKAPDVSVLGDMAKSAMSGLRSGTESLVGMFGDANRMTGDIAGWAAGKVGASPETQQTIRTGAQWASPFPQAPTTDQLRGITNDAVGEAYQPQTTAGEYARTVGEFAPAAMAGPGSIGRKAMIGGLSALGSETAGQLTEGTAAEPFARAGGALVGGIAGAKVPGGGRKALPTAKDIKASAGYEDLKPVMQGARIDKSDYRSIVRELQGVADDFGMVPEDHGAFQRIIQRHLNQSKTNGASLQDLEILRRSLSNAGKNVNNRSAGELSRRMIDALDNAVEALPGAEKSMGGATVGETIDSLKGAREAWRTGMKAEMVEMAMENAKDTASGFENGLRIEFRKILNNKTLSRMFTDQEKTMMKKVVRGTFKGNMLRLLGGFGIPTDNARNFLGAMSGGTIGSTAGALFVGPMGAAIGGPALMGAGTLAKVGSNAITRNQAQLVEQLVKAGPKGQKAFQEAMMELQAARNLGLIRSAVHGNQALNSSLAR